MSKLYVLDNKLLTDTTEIRIGEKIYAVDNRQKTVKKIHVATKAISSDNPYADIDAVLELALGTDAAKEIDGMDLSYPAYVNLFELVMAAVAGDEPGAVERALRGDHGN